MKELSLEKICKVNTKTDSFVGIQVTGEDISVYFPLGFRLSDSDMERRKDVLLLLNVLSNNTDREESRIDSSGKQKDMSMPIYAYLFVISDYYSRGYYRESETINCISKRGKINWGKTIKTQRPIIDNDELFFFDFVTRKQNVNDKELITLIHEYCVYESFERIGWIFTSFKPPKPKLSKNRRLFSNVIKKKISETFNDINKQLFENLLAIINTLGDDNAPKDYRFGTRDFEYVWESMIDKAYGIKNKVDYYPSTRWVIDDKEYENHYLRPDSIMLANGKVYVLDAKYYRYGETGNGYNLPQSADINKQITYGEYIAEADAFQDADGNNPTVYNAFIMPYDSFGDTFHTERTLHYFGNALSDWKASDGIKPYEKVAGILLDVKTIMKDYSHNDRRINELIEIIENNIGL